MSDIALHAAQDGARRARGAQPAPRWSAPPHRRQPARVARRGPARAARVARAATVFLAALLLWAAPGRVAAQDLPAGCQTPPCQRMVLLCGTYLQGTPLQLFACLCQPVVLDDAAECFSTCGVANVNPEELKSSCEEVNKPITPTPTPAPASGGLSTGAIIGIAVGGAAVLLLAGLAAFFLIRRSRSKKAADANGDAAAKGLPPTPEHQMSNIPPPPPPADNATLKSVGSASLVGPPAPPYVPTAPPMGRNFSVRSGETAVPTLAEHVGTGDLAGIDCTVVRTYVPEREDEILLNVGDGVRIIEAFEDGWAKGENKLTKQEGMFPLACVVRIGAGGPPSPVSGR